MAGNVYVCDVAGLEGIEGTTDLPACSETVARNRTLFEKLNYELTFTPQWHIHFVVGLFFLQSIYFVSSLSVYNKCLGRRLFCKYFTFVFVQKLKLKRPIVPLS